MTRTFSSVNTKWSTAYCIENRTPILISTSKFKKAKITIKSCK